MKQFRLLTLCTLLAVTSACGFSMRGSDSLSANFDNLQFYSEQSNSDFSRLLQRSLIDADLNLIEVDPEDADPGSPLFGIASEQLVSRPVTINSRARAAQIELRLSVIIGLMDGEQPIIAPETLFVERTYFQDVENISGNQEEAEIIAQELRRELVDQIMRRLAAVEVN